MDNDIIDSDGKVINVCDVLGGMSAVTRKQKVAQRFKIVRDLWYSHKMVANELKEKFNIDCDENWNEKIILGLELANHVMKLLADTFKKKEKREERKRIGDSFFKNLYEGHEDYTDISKDLIDKIDEKHKKNLEKLATLEAQCEFALEALENTSKNIGEKIAIALYDAMILLEQKLRSE